MLKKGSIRRVCSQVINRKLRPWCVHSIGCQMIPNRANVCLPSDRHCWEQKLALLAFAGFCIATLDTLSYGRAEMSVTGGDTPQPQQNHLLGALSPEVQARLFPGVFPHLELVPLPLRAVMYESGVP